MINIIQNRLVLIAVVAAVAGSFSGCSESGDSRADKARIAELEAKVAELEAHAAQTAPPPAATPDSAGDAPVPNQGAAAKPPAEPETPWDYTTREDPMTGKTVRMAVVTSSNTVNFEPPYSGDQQARLILRTGPGKGDRDAMVVIQQGQILCHSYSECTVTVRFDDHAPERFSGTGPADNSTETVFLDNYGRFAEKLAKSQRVRIAFDVYQNGRPFFEFDVAGFKPGNLSAKN